MRRLLILIIGTYLFLCAANYAFGAGLLTGMTPSNYTIPDGWTLIRAQGFENGCNADEECGSFDGSITTTKPHTGSYSIEGTYANDQADVHWELHEGSTGSFSEIYISFYEWIHTDATFNDEFFEALFKKTLDPATDEFWTLFLDWYWAYETDPNTPGFNKENATLYMVKETRGSYDSLPDERMDGTSTAVPQGSWVQWEIHIKPGLTDGFFRVYKDGALWLSRENANVSGTLDLTDMSIRVGGVYTKLVWMDDYPTCTSCSQPGVGTDGCTSLMGWWGQSFSSPQCSPTDPALSSFTRYIDDIIVMKGSTTPGVDVTPPATSNHDPAKSATGVPKSTTSVLVDITDTGLYKTGVKNDLTTTPAMSVEGTTLHCGDTNLTCTSITDGLRLEYKGLSFSNDQVVNVTVDAEDEVGNIMAQDVYSFTIESASPSSLTFSAPTLPAGTQGEAYSYDLTQDISGGVQPYTCSMNSGTLPRSVKLNSSTCELEGIAVAVGTVTGLDFKVTDSDTTPSTATTGAVSLAVNPATPSGVTTKIWSENSGSDYTSVVSDTANINSVGYTATNFSTDTDMQVYTYPANTAAVIGMMKFDISGLPANATIISAYLMMDMFSYQGDGGDSSSNVGLFRITGTEPDLTKCTWETQDGTNAWSGGQDGGMSHLSSSSFATTAVSKTYGWYTWDVTDFIQGISNGTYSNKGFGLYITSPSSTDANRKFYTSEATDGLRPELIISYTTSSTEHGPGRGRFNLRCKFR